VRGHPGYSEDRAARGKLKYALRQERYIEQSQTIFCACGCGETLKERDGRNRPRKYISGHQAKTLVFKRQRPYPPSPLIGRPLSAKARENLSKALLALKRVPHNKGKPGHYRGSRHHSWRGGITALYPCTRVSSYQWKAIRKQVYLRDNHACVVCRKNCERWDIACHHIRPVRYGGSDDLFNLATVCKSCHQRQEHKFGKPDYFWGLFDKESKPRANSSQMTLI
jgi:5-methylcytosine-specific restriction protein A